MTTSDRRYLDHITMILKLKIGEDNISFWKLVRIIGEDFSIFENIELNFPNFENIANFRTDVRSYELSLRFLHGQNLKKRCFFRRMRLIKKKKIWVIMVWVCLSLSLCLSVSRFDVHMVLKKIFRYSDSRSIVWIGLILKTFWPILIVFWTNSIFDQFRRGDPYGINLSENEIFRCITFDNKTFLRSWRTRWPTGL